MATTYLTRTAETPTLGTKCTISCWVKRSSTATGEALFSAYTDTNERHVFGFNDRNIILFGKQGGSTNVNLETVAKFQDPSAFYHLVCTIDTTQVTAADRVKIYVNGVQQTAFDQSTYPAQNDILEFQVNNASLSLGAKNHGSFAEYFNGLISYFAFVDGTAYDASYFGETDSSSGIWKIKTAPSVTYGTNGFFLKMDTSSPGTDTSGNSNTFTASGTPTLTQDNASNVFATMNPLDNYWQGSTLSNGNTTVLTGSSSTTYNTSSIMVNTGKFYAECKVITGSATANIGIAGEMADAAVGVLKAKEFGYAYIDDGQFGNNGSASSYGASYANGDIIGIALDCTNNKLYFSKNGVFQDSGNPSAGSGGKTITAPASTPIGNYAFACNDTWNDNTRTFSWNFGNGFFGTTAVTSAGTAASTPGIFEYDVPTGYQPLSTKGLNA
jgi:hypothetical protein